jgi:hypothetical protein
VTYVKYTRELLAATAARSSSINDMMRHLGVPLAGGTNTHLSRRLVHYGIDTSHFHALSEQRRHARHRYDRDTLAEAAAHSRSVRDMIDHLGVEPYDSLYGYLRRRLDDLGIDHSHFVPRFQRSDRAGSAFTREGLTLAVAESQSIAGVIRSLNLPDHTGSRRRLKKAIAEYALDTAHFTGQAHNRGRFTGPKDPGALLVLLPPGSRRTSGVRLRKALVSLGIPDVCSACGQGPEWLGARLPLEVDHVSGDWLDNRRENLRLLCPNCHATTLTYCRKRPARLAGQR